MIDPADKPPDKQTVEIPSEGIQTGLINKLVEAVNSLRTEFHETAGAVRDIGKRVGSLEDRADRVDQRANTSSMRARSESEMNLAQDAALARALIEQANEKTAREALAVKVDSIETKADAQDVKITSIETKTDAQTAILQRLDKLATSVAADPRVKWIVAAAWTAFVAWMAKKGFGP